MPTPSITEISKPGRHHRRRPGGFLYVAVLFTTLIVMTVVATSLSISTTNLHGERDRAFRGEALRYAESEIHRLAAGMRTSSQWRSDSTNDVFTDWYSIDIDGVAYEDNRQLRHRLVDVDGDLADDPSDSVTVTVHARVGRSEAALSVDLESDPAPLDLLRYSVVTTDDLRIESNASLSCERPVAVLEDCQGDPSGILTTPELRCSGTIDVTLRGDLAAGVGTLATDDVVATYVAAGTEIPVSLIPQPSGDLLLQDLVLGPTINPFGSPDPAGIYWINAQGNKLVLSHCRISATLAVTNASDVELRGGIVWGFPDSAEAILVTDGNLQIEAVEAMLDETARNTNFNPASLPYRRTQFNNTTSDVYPTQLAGVLYTSGELRIGPLVADAGLPIQGILMGHVVRIEGRVAITHLDEVLVEPPLGMADPTPMRLVRGTFRRIPTE